MIQKVITYLNAKLELTNYFSSIYEIAELIKKSDEKVSPKAYCSNGEFKELSNYDYSYGQSYWRKNGDVSLSLSENDTIGCNKAIVFKVPLKLVCFIPKAKLSTDNAYTDDLIANTLIKQLTTNNGELRASLKAKKFSVVASRYITDNQTILSSEYKGYKIPDINHNIAFVSIDFDIEIVAGKSCIETECDTIDNDILHIFDFCDDTVAERLTATQVACLETRYGIACENVIITNSVGVQKYSKASGETQAIPKHTIYKSNGSTVVTTKEFDENYTTPAVTITTSEGGTVSKEAGESYTCTLYPSSTYNFPEPTGQTVIYRTGDDADIHSLYFSSLVQGVKNSLVDFFTLASNNSFGNTNRFTDINGLQVYGNGYKIDNYTGIGWGLLKSANTWDNAIDTCLALTENGFSDYFLPNLNIIISIVNVSAVIPSYSFSCVGYTPMSYVPVTSQLWTSSNRGTSALKQVLNTDTRVFYEPEANLNNYIPCRKHF